MPTSQGPSQTPESPQTKPKLHRQRALPFSKKETQLNGLVGVLSDITLSSRHLGSLHGTHLLSPSLGGLNLSHCSELIGRVARDTNVVIALQNDLDVTNFESGGLAEFGKFAGGDDDVVNKFVGNVEENLHTMLVL